MARKAREKIPFGTYLIEQSCMDDQFLFESDADRRKFLERTFDWNKLHDLEDDLAEYEYLPTHKKILQPPQKIVFQIAQTEPALVEDYEPRM